MTGIAFKIAGDFSNSPLGKISLFKTNEELADIFVSDFETKIEDVSYHDTLKSMVKNLLDNNLYDKITCLFPILSDKSKSGINLINPDDSGMKVSDYSASFSNNILTYTQADAGDLRGGQTYNIEKDNALAFISLKLNPTVNPNGRGIFGTGIFDGANINAGFMRMDTSFSSNSINGSKDITLTTANTGSVPLSSTDGCIGLNIKKNIIGRLTPTGRSIFIDGIIKVSDTIVSTSLNLNQGACFGNRKGTTGRTLTTPVSENFFGDIYLCGYAKSMTDAEVLVFNQILDDFIIATKNV